MLLDRSGQGKGLTLELDSCIPSVSVVLLFLSVIMALFLELLVSEMTYFVLSKT